MLETTSTFSNTAAITIPGTGTSGPASPYPPTITIAGFTGTVARVTVTLKQFSHTFPDDIDVLLVGPTGAKFILMSDALSSPDATGQTYTFDDRAATGLPDGSGAPSGTYRPTNHGTGDTFPGPAPAGPYLTAAPAGTDSLTSAFGGLNPNGTWRLFVVDDVGGDVGAIAGGWELNRHHVLHRAPGRGHGGFQRRLRQRYRGVSPVERALAHARPAAGAVRAAWRPPGGGRL